MSAAARRDIAPFLQRVRAFLLGVSKFKFLISCNDCNFVMCRIM